MSYYIDVVDNFGSTLRLDFTPTSFMVGNTNYMIHGKSVYYSYNKWARNSGYSDMASKDFITALINYDNDNKLSNFVSANGCITPFPHMLVV